MHINPALQGRLGLPPQAVPAESQRLLLQFEEATGPERSWEPQPAEGTMLGSWPATRGRSGTKRKPPAGGRNAKMARRSSSPLLPDEQKEVGPLKGHFDWDALLDSALSGELSLEAGDTLSLTQQQEGAEPEPAPPQDGPQGSGHVQDFDEETFLATAFLQGPWAEEEEQGPWAEEEEQGRSDFLCSSSVNLETLFDLGDSLGPRMEALL